MSSKRKQHPAKAEKSCDKRTKGSGRNYINSLPEELLCMVFDRVCLYTVKTASLVCRKWNEILFSGTYANRFVFGIIEKAWIPGDSIVRLIEGINVLARSKRDYRRVSFIAGE
uniref:F-box domain-containing protein n=2 Tax=Anopheles albimanus TaxID=7167 RepID=A0A182FZ81_ANOAL